MTPQICRYAIVQFTPFSETGEFANVGVVLTCPKTGFFKYRLQKRKYKRITDFFEGIERSDYLNAVAATEFELEYVIRKTLNESADKLRHYFTSLVRPREGIIKFSNERALLCESPEKELDRLFAHYVEHSFATRQYVEERMNSHIRTLLNNLDLEAPFKAERLGNEDMHTQFQFVQVVDSKPLKLIKALNLSQRDALSIGDHGDSWIGRIKRLSRVDPNMPEHKLFTVALAPAEDSPRHQVGQEVVQELKRLGIEVVDNSLANANEKITQFALQKLH
ncbi:DUF3037 domain-containing protein [Comamonas kerstersii]